MHVLLNPHKDVMLQRDSVICSCCSLGILLFLKSIAEFSWRIIHEMETVGGPWRILKRIGAYLQYTVSDQTLILTAASGWEVQVLLMSEGLRHTEDLQFWMKHSQKLNFLRMQYWAKYGRQMGFFPFTLGKQNRGKHQQTDNYIGISSLCWPGSFKHRLLGETLWNWKPDIFHTKVTTMRQPTVRALHNCPFEQLDS